MIIHVSRDIRGMLVLTCKIEDYVAQRIIDVNGFGGSGMSKETATRLVFKSLESAWMVFNNRKKIPKDLNGQR